MANKKVPKLSELKTAFEGAEFTLGGKKVSEKRFFKSIAEEINPPKKRAKKYRANFLFGFPDDSIETLGYEFANGKTEAYLEVVWKELIEKLSAPQAGKWVQASERLPNKEGWVVIKKDNYELFVMYIKPIEEGVWIPQSYQWLDEGSTDKKETNG